MFEGKLLITRKESSRLRIAYLTQQLDPLDKGSWSGGLYYMGKALQQYCGDVTNLGPLDSHIPSLWSKVRARMSLQLFKKRYLHYLSLASAQELGSMAAQKLAGQTFDIAVVAAGGMEIAFLETSLPIVLIGDATFAQLIDYHPYYAHLSRRSIREIQAIERHVFKKVSVVIMTSEWAARSVIQDYHVAPERVHVISFGANFDTIPARESIESKRLSGIPRLLFMGVEWERKGGGYRV